jgi:serine protease Do
VATLLFATFAFVAVARTFGQGASLNAGVPSEAALGSGAPLTQPSDSTSPESLAQSFRNVAKVVGPAVVHINVVQEVDPHAGVRGLPFGFDIPELTPRPQRGSGSGVIVSPNGYIVTNNHVVGDASKIEVKLADGRRLKGTVVGTDSETDLAVVKVDATGLPAASLGDSEALEQGDWVVAIGSPFRLEQTITAGIVSAKGRRVSSASPYDAFIQTDASINPGNSGGPLVNLRGEVVGINTMIFSQTGTNSGIGFAIPSSMVRKIYEQLVAKGKVSRGYLGVNVQDVEPAIAESLNLPEGTKGAVVGGVANSDSPAAKAGLKSGDVITSVNGTSVASSQELTSLVADISPGSTAEVRFLRDGQEQATRVTLAERPSRAELTGQPSEEEGQGMANPSRNAGWDKLGISVTPLTPDIADQLNVQVPTGVVVNRVSNAGPAAEAGLRRGDVIHRVGRTAVTSQADYDRAVAQLQSGSTVALQIERGGQMVFVTVQVG